MTGLAIGHLIGMWACFFVLGISLEFTAGYTIGVLWMWITPILSGERT